MLCVYGKQYLLLFNLIDIKFYIYIFNIVARKNEVIKMTEILLNALNQGDYETYTRLCDPHMTSFEPENLGNLIDNMEYRQFCLDQARQLQFSHQLQLQQQQQIISQQQQVAAIAAASAAAAAAAAAANSYNNNNNNDNISSNNNNQTTNSSQQSSPSVKLNSASGQQQIQQIAAAAASAALANLNLNSTSDNNNHINNQQQLFLTRVANSASTTTTTTINSCRQYSLMLNPSVYLIGDDAASIAYTKLDQLIDLRTGSLNVEKSEETRVWHKKDGNKWLCVHLHRSLGGQTFSGGNKLLEQAIGPQTNASLIRSVGNQQQLANWVTLQSQQQQQRGGVPLISLNHSSANNSGSLTSNSTTTGQAGTNPTTTTR